MSIIHLLEDAKNTIQGLEWFIGRDEKAKKAVAQALGGTEIRQLEWLDKKLERSEVVVDEIDAFLEGYKEGQKTNEK